jgi:periodic tryptophan protein 2
VEKAVRRIQSEHARLADENIYRIEYLLAQPSEKKGGAYHLDFEVKAIENGVVDEDMEDDEDEEDAGDWLGFD